MIRISREGLIMGAGDNNHFFIVSQTCQQLRDLRRVIVIQRTRRLICEKNTGGPHQCPRYRDTLLFPTR